MRSVGILVCKGISVPEHKGLLWSGTEPLCTESGCTACKHCCGGRCRGSSKLRRLHIILFICQKNNPEFFARMQPEGFHGPGTFILPRTIHFNPGQPALFEFQVPRKISTLCHHFQLVFTDGACSNNGMDYARSGLGITMGGDEYSWSVFVDDTIDPGAPRTNQRAELLAAIEGLKKLHESNINKDPVYHKKLIRRHKEQERSIYIVVTDSEYVVKGITEWLPSWRERGWRTSDGKQPKNLDLFMKLDEYISSVEQVLVDVSFFHVPRAHNRRADSLAKRAASL